MVKLDKINKTGRQNSYHIASNSSPENKVSIHAAFNPVDTWSG